MHRIRRGIWRVSVQKYREYHKQRPQRELERQVKVEQVHGGHAGNNDSQRGGETFQNIVRVLDDHRDQQPPARLQDDQVPNELVVPEVETPSLDLSAV